MRSLFAQHASTCFANTKGLTSSKQIGQDTLDDNAIRCSSSSSSVEKAGATLLFRELPPGEGFSRCICGLALLCSFSLGEEGAAVSVIDKDGWLFFSTLLTSAVLRFAKKDRIPGFSSAMSALIFAFQSKVGTWLDRVRGMQCLVSARKGNIFLRITCHFLKISHPRLPPLFLFFFLPLWQSFSCFPSVKFRRQSQKRSLLDNSCLLSKEPNVGAPCCEGLASFLFDGEHLDRRKKRKERKVRNN